jgi:hypothetical protein
MGLEGEDSVGRDWWWALRRVDVLLASTDHRDRFQVYSIIPDTA